MQCPQCGTETSDLEWNCQSCRINMYWAARHYEDLARIRQDLGLPAGAATPHFLIGTHASAMAERAGKGGRTEHRVRKVARFFMRGSS
jgi:hypothetical protein